MMSDSIELRQLHEALVDAFPSQAALAQMLLLELGVNLDAVALGANLEEVVYRLLVWAQARGRFDDLVLAAARANPTNPKLQDVLADKERQYARQFHQVRTLAFSVTLLGAPLGSCAMSFGRVAFSGGGDLPVW